MRVVGCAGQARMGKDEMALKLIDELDMPWERTAFADGVKKVYQDTFNVNRKFIEEWKVKPEPPPGFDMNVRQALQFIGGGFRKIQSNIWLDLVFRNLKEVDQAKIISDVRYPNEWQRIKYEGGYNILIGRPDKLNDDPADSESIIRPLIVWCLDNLPDGITEINLDMFEKHNDMPEELRYFNLFVKNNKSLEEYWCMIKETSYLVAKFFR